MYNLINNKAILIEANRKKKIFENNKRIIIENNRRIIENNRKMLSYKKDENRINFYLGDLDKNIIFKDLYNDVNNLENSSLVDGCLYKFFNLEELKNKINKMDNNHKKLYLNILYNTLLKYNICKDFTFFVKTGDIQDVITVPCFTKNIINERENNKGVILRCMNYSRHWNDYYNKTPDLPFEKKMNKIVWRGSTTGEENRKGNRFILIKKWFNKHRNIDIGFTNICQDKNKYNFFKKPNMTIREMLNYKYIISVEGNDKDSGINWKLNSNSLVLMPKPTVSSWLMETTLIPNYHYVLLEDDFSNLQEKLIWCENNQQNCKEIIKNANNYMKQFADENYEQFLEKCVIEEYFNFYNLNHIS
jgi:hypothetical protein